MKETTFVIMRDPRGWCVRADEKLHGFFRSKSEAFEAAVRAARQCRAAGRYAWVKLRHSEELNPEGLSRSRS
jgi:hypothetical protein